MQLTPVITKRFDTDQPSKIDNYEAQDGYDALLAGDDQIVSRDVLEMLTPEIYEGRPPVNRQELDAHGQYYLGLLGLEWRFYQRRYYS